MRQRIHVYGIVETGEHWWAWEGSEIVPEVQPPAREHTWFDLGYWEQDAS